MWVGATWVWSGVMWVWLIIVVAMVYSIGRGIGYKSELSDLSDGSTLIVGGKEVEVSVCVCACVMRSTHCMCTWCLHVMNVVF